MRLSLLSSLALSLALVSSAGAAPHDWSDVVGPEAVGMRAQWSAFLEKGENLALERPVTFTHWPTYRLTYDEGDTSDLTDGKLAGRVDDRIWFHREACAWYSQPAPIAFFVDLGESEAISHLGIRLLGGREQDSLEFPGKIEVIASEDGKTFYNVAQREKLLPSEKAQADGREQYYLEEEGKAYVYPFAFEVNFSARYVGFRITSNTMIASDEMAILQSGKEAPSVATLKLPAVPLITKGIGLQPRKEEVVISTNVLTANWFLLQDSRPAENRNQAFSLVMQLPVGLEILPVEGQRMKRGEENEGLVAYTFDYPAGRGAPETLQGPFFFKAGEGVAAWGRVRMWIEAEGFAPHEHEAGYRLLEVPEVPPLKHLHVSLAWMVEAWALQWPDFLHHFRRLGFNTVSFFPRYYGKQEGAGSPHRQRALALLEEARANDFRILYNESPFHPLEKKALEEAPEALNQIGGQPGKHLSPLYRGDLYREEIERVAAHAALIKPDYVMHDIELFYEATREARLDPAAQAAAQRAGKSWEDLATDLGAEMLSDLKKAILERAREEGFPAPLIGQYNLDAAKGVYELTFDWKKSYPSGVDFASPSLYLRGNAARIHQNIRENYRSIGSRKIIPWLTAGTYGEFDPSRMEPMIYEAFLNGSNGITYYEYRDFDPEDFYYQAVALKRLAPFERLLSEGRPVKVTSENPELLCSAFGNGEEALLLVGNYLGAETHRAELELPFSVGTTVVDLREGNAAPRPLGQRLVVEIPARGFKLYHLKTR